MMPKPETPKTPSVDEIQQWIDGQLNDIRMMRDKDGDPYFDGQAAMLRAIRSYLSRPTISPQDPAILRAGLKHFGPSHDGAVERDLAAAGEAVRGRNASLKAIQAVRGDDYTDWHVEALEKIITAYGQACARGALGKAADVCRKYAEEHYGAHLGHYAKELEAFERCEEAIRALMEKDG
jgi:hypothetical protein